MKKVIASWKSLTKEPPSKHRDLKRDLPLPHSVEHTRFYGVNRCCNILICPLDVVTGNGIK
jgi:hypothetical protein